MSPRIRARFSTAIAAWVLALAPLARAQEPKPAPAPAPPPPAARPTEPAAQPTAKPRPDAVDPTRKELDRKLSEQEVAEQFKQAVELMGETADRLQTSRDTGLTTQRLQ